MTSQPTLVLDRVLRVLRPLVRLLVRNGVTYPVLAAALKRVFLDAARSELASRKMAQTDSAVSLLCGVHRRDVRTLGAASPAVAATAPGPLGMAAQVVARWMNGAGFQDTSGAPRVLNKSGGADSFDALVASVSSDVRPRAVLDDLVRLGVVEEGAGGVKLERSGFAPRQGFEELSWLFAANLADHAAAAAANLQDEGNFLEQAMYADEITAESAERLQKAALQAWKVAFKSVMAEAQARVENDASRAPEERRHRARFGVYFFSQPED
jgi:hypothetical protein